MPDKTERNGACMSLTDQLRNMIGRARDMVSETRPERHWQKATLKRIEDQVAELDWLLFGPFHQIPTAEIAGVLRRLLTYIETLRYECCRPAKDLCDEANETIYRLQEWNEPLIERPKPPSYPQVPVTVYGLPLQPSMTTAKSTQ